MKALSKFGLVVAVALVACAALAASAQAGHEFVEINPDDTTITGVAGIPH